MFQCLGQIRAFLLILIIMATTSSLVAHDYPHLVKVKVGEQTTFRVLDAATCSATIWIDNIENESLFSVSPNQADGISVEFTIQANETPGETVITIQWVGEDVGSDEGGCTEDTRDFGGVQITVRVTSDKVNSVGDDATAEAGDGHCDTGNNIEINGEDVPECTLRAAIEEVNAGGWESVIEFDIPGPEPHNIKPESALPAVEKPTVITGYGVGSAKLNQIQNRIPTIILNGADNDIQANGLVLNVGASGTLIEGLGIIGFGGHGVVILADEVIIKSNYIGTDLGGSANQGNEKSGIFINEGVGNQIGGDSPEDRNVISGNLDHGVEINSGSLNRILGNWIGLKPDSSGVIGNKKSGVQINEGTNHAVGAFTDTPGMAPGNVISGNKDGIFIDSNEIFVRGNVIGDTQTDPEAEKIYANTNSGITVEGNTISIGGTGENEANVIAGNGGTGVFVDKTLTQSVSIRGNSIFNNTLLGIDLTELGVTDNDSLDFDQGPNGLINYPVIDSVVTPDPYPDGAIVSVHGKLNSTPNSSFFIDVYMSDGCDDSKYGEGQIYLGEAALSTDAMGNGTFQLTFVSTGDKRYDGSKSITTTTSDGVGNTSEFSACSRATILLVDLTQLPIKEKTFAYFKVTDNSPIFTETFIDSISTNEDGIIFKDSLNARDGDKIIFRRKMMSQNRVKNLQHTTTSYNIFLDNIHIEDGGVHTFFELDDKKQNQKTTVRHTVVGFNLTISIEWWASRVYVNDMLNSLRLGSNYLYNVSDGQMKLDTVAIFIDKVFWDDVDVRYHATNQQWPEAIVDGISKSDENAKIYMPRRWYGGGDPSRNNSVVAETALELTSSGEFRTFIHELGHYALGLYDEYNFPGSGVRCDPNLNYGFMDYHYSGANSTDMSWSHQYQNTDCRNNKQYLKHHSGNWEFVNNRYENIYDGIYTPITIPSERALPTGSFSFIGPNENFNALNYNVGSRMTFIAPGPETPFVTKIITAKSSSGDTLKNAKIIQKRAIDNRVIQQGSTSDSGGIAIIGYAEGDKVEAVGTIYNSSVLKVLNVDDEVEWYSGELESDSDELILNKASGIKPILPELRLSADGFGVEIVTETVVSALPDVSFEYNDTTEDASLSLTNKGLLISHATNEPQSGSIKVSTLDALNTPFFFRTYYEYAFSSDVESIAQLSSSSSDFSASLAETEYTFDRVLILTSDFPVPTSGLEENSRKVSPAFGFIYEIDEINAEIDLEIRYSELNLDHSDDELSVKIFRWDSNVTQWKQMGGQVDTLHNVVSTTVAEPGIYAAFTSTTTTSIERNSSEMPEQFRLHQNYPNPFNPTTTIPFDVAEAIHVKLTVYDILGREVITLVNEQKSAGSYSAIFNSGQLSSGVYMYRIVMGQFSDTRRMMLVK